MRDLEIPADYNFLEECTIFGFHLRGEIFEVVNFYILNAKYYYFFGMDIFENKNQNKGGLM